MEDFISFCLRPPRNWRSSCVPVKLPWMACWFLLKTLYALAVSSLENLSRNPKCLILSKKRSVYVRISEVYKCFGLQLPRIQILHTIFRKRLLKLMPPLQSRSSPTCRQRKAISGSLCKTSWTVRLLSEPFSYLSSPLAHPLERFILCHPARRKEPSDARMSQK